MRGEGWGGGGLLWGEGSLAPLCPKFQPFLHTHLYEGESELGEERGHMPLKEGGVGEGSLGTSKWGG